MKQDVRALQVLSERWEVEYRRPGYGRPIEARMTDWPNTTKYALHARGDSVDEARLNLVVKLASAIADDPSAFE